MEQMSIQKRLLLAALLSIVFFIVYDFFMPKRVIPEQNQTTMSQTIDQNKAPNINQNTSKSNIVRSSPTRKSPPSCSMPTSRSM